MKDEAVGVLVSFMKDMNKWETSYHDAFMADYCIDKKPYASELNEIFNKWCTVKERKNGRQVAMQVSSPPDYDPENDEIMEVEVVKNKASIVVQKHTGFKNKYRYTLQFKNNEWRIDKKERFSSSESKWIKDNI
ncbi:NTF2 fold immunity protein [Serratia fonticola]|uniref:NTF2 fold immunity protein n=1 Tax=Serratia fonticola TaxID=47917 RepID=A0ABY9PTF9_SERFO|nr:NTF2 fold immunity protein [Serratia fonticola]WMT16734.1 NTF2 fold immunity protein [Serratia fonticola]